MTMGFNYCSHKKQYSFQSRDFVEKGFNFYHNGKFYRYSTSLPEELGLARTPVPADTTRGFTYYNFAIVERNPKDGKIYSRSCTQCDFKTQIPAFMINSFLPNSTKAWYANLTKYYMKNKK